MIAEMRDKHEYVEVAFSIMRVSIHSNGYCSFFVLLSPKNATNAIIGFLIPHMAFRDNISNRHTYLLVDWTRSG
jgi:hypothetical protein